jgi:hypothetical protein
MFAASPLGEEPFGRRRWALIHAGDDSLPALLGDVLCELGLLPSAHGPDDADLVLVHVEGPAGLAHLDRAARRHGPRAVILALLPFADDRLRRDALARGARGVFALGTPLTQLRDVVGAALRGATGG